MEDKALKRVEPDQNAPMTPAVTHPLSTSQREVWLDQMAWPQSTHLNIGGGIYLQGPLNLALLHAALIQLAQDNQTLRLVPYSDGTQKLLETFSPEFPVTDLDEISSLFNNASEIDPAAAKAAMRQHWQKTMQEPFVLGEGPLWRFALIRAHPELHGLSIQFHHMITDGWTTSLILQRWTTIYNTLLAGEQSVRPNSPDYLKFVEDSLQYTSSEAFERDRQYWLTQVPALPAPLIERRGGVHGRQSLPTSHLVIQKIPRQDYRALEAFAIHHQVTAFNVFLAALTLYFGQIYKQTRVVAGVPNLNRGGRRFRETLGMFVGVLAVGVDIKPELAVSELLSAIAMSMRGALRHPRLPLSELGRSLEVIRSGRDGIFDLLLSFERQDYKLAFGGAQLVDIHQTFAGFSRYPCSVTVCEFHDDEDVEVVVEASSDSFGAGEAALLGKRLWHIVQQIVANPEQLVGSLSLIPDSERQLLMEGLQPAQAATTEREPFICQFERQAAQRPESIAVVWNQGRMTYLALNEKADRLAIKLMQMGVGKNQIVAFAIERSVEMVIAILGIAKSGAAFLPLDPDAPVVRIQEVLELSGCVAFLIKNAQAERFGSLHAQTLLIDRVLVEPTAPLSQPKPRPGLRDMAYVLFTSGSTGKPKGVVIENEALAHRLAWLTKAYSPTAADRSAQATQITFDPSLIELCLPLVHGGGVALPPPGRLLPESLADFAVTHGVTIMAFVPSTMSRFLDAAAGRADLKLRVACCGGEVLSPDLANRFLVGTQGALFNVYGPTEATIFATAWKAINSPGLAVLPIGKAIDDTRIYVLGAALELLPLGVTGEVYIGGGALARGYLNRPDLTTAAFMDDPHHPGGRIYKTGDRGWLDPDGTLQFIGRIDRQIKLRGYRIELGEIEAALLALPGVTQTAAKLVERDDKPQICAWVSPSSGLSAEKILHALRMKLPSYMVPSILSLLDHLPESSAGKVDYHALQVPRAEASVTVSRQPSNEMERELLALWQKVLKRPQLHVEDNFFDAGGDSLAAVSILTGIEKLIGRRVPMYLLTERPTVEGLAAALSEGTAATGLLVNLEPAPSISAIAAEKAAPLYLAASGHGDLMRFQTLAKTLRGAPEVRMLQPPSASTVVRTVDLATMYADVVVSQGTGPCYLAGFSVGGLAALETALQLKQRGIDVRGLFLVDTIYPSRLWGGTILWKTMGWLVRHLHIQDLSMNGRRLGAMLNDPGLVGQVMAVSGYRASFFDGPTHLIKSQGLASTWDRLLFLGWRQHVGKKLLEHRVKGMHGSMFDLNNVEDLAKAIRAGTNSAPLATTI